MRCSSTREHDKLRKIRITRDFTKYAEGSVLVEFGVTKVICNASVLPTVPRWLKGTGQGWVTAEYSMLPRATHDRIQREIGRHGPTGRTQEIQRLIGRSLRAAVDRKALNEYTIAVDCDVIQADGGTRSASITGGCVALYDAIRYLKRHNLIQRDPFNFFIASVSVGIYESLPILDLNYAEDSHAETDMNVVMTENGSFVEVQGTAEAVPFQYKELEAMLGLAQRGISQLIQKQKEAVGIV